MGRQTFISMNILPHPRQKNAIRVFVRSHGISRVILGRIGDTSIINTGLITSMRVHRSLWWMFFLFCILLLGLLAAILMLSSWPAIGARMARPMRQVIGNRGVAIAEIALFSVQDATQLLKYNLIPEEPDSPWEVTAVASDNPAFRPTSYALKAVGPLPAKLPTPMIFAPKLAEPLPTARTMPTSTPAPTATPTNEAIPTPPGWTLPALSPFGTVEGEGLWQPYLFDAQGQVLALRTFLQPDPERPYALVAIVAFDLERVELHYFLGAREPALSSGPRGNGLIAETDIQPGKLLATFNGGFMASHGEYGAMSGNIIALPAKNGFGTVAIYSEGQIQIGEWGKDIGPTETVVAWRQNARLVIENGEINERVFNGSIATWGGSFDGDIVTWRSGLGLTVDGKILYYFAGPSMSMPTLAKAMKSARVHNGMLLDINPTWVHFATIQAEGDGLSAVPLFEEGMDTQIDRFLKQSDRDFFYITGPS